MAMSSTEERFKRMTKADRAMAAASHIANIDVSTRALEALRWLGHVPQDSYADQLAALADRIKALILPQ